MTEAVILYYPAGRCRDNRESGSVPWETVRHSCASLLYANGVALKNIQEWLGHSDIGTTGNIYTHLDYSSKVSSAQAIVGILPGTD